ncbi:MAG: tetratricopeptide repeat protein [Acidobacteriota bacterium]
MNISAMLQRLTGNKGSDEATGCPDEAGLLSYSDGRLSASDRGRFETHLAKCDDCRELVAVAVRETGEARHAEPVSEREVKQQSARVLAYIALDESNQGRANIKAAKHRESARTGSRLSYPRLASAALVMCAVSAVGIFLVIKDSPEAAAMATLRQAMKDERRNQALISGDIPYSPYLPIRGEQESDDLNYERALNKVESVDKDTAPVERHTQARILLAMAGDNTRRALAILEQLEAAGVQSADLFNDLGLARLQLGKYDAAVECFRKAYEKSPGDTRFLFNKALAEQKANHTDEARQDWNKFIEATPDERLKAEARAQLGLIR